MSEKLETFFMSCPSCGRRFHVKLVDRTLVDVKRETLQEPVAAQRIGGRPMGVGMSGPIAANPIVVQETVPVVINVEDLQYTFKCGRCGHQWKENRTERKKGV